MCETCRIASLCTSSAQTTFGESQFAVGKLVVKNTPRIAICSEERGLEQQHIFISCSGLLPLAETLLFAFRQLALRS